MQRPLRSSSLTLLALLLGSAPALSQGLGSRDRITSGPGQPAAPTERPGATAGPAAPSLPGPFGQPPVGQGPETSVYGGGLGGPTAPYGAAGRELPVPQDTYAGQWQGQASWPMPGGLTMNFPVSIDVQRDGQGYRILYSADVPAQAPDIQPSPTRWTGTFRGGIQQNPGMGQGQPTQGPGGAPAFSFLMGESQDYTVTVKNTGQTQGPWYVSIGLMAENGRLMGQVGSQQIGFAQFQLNRAGAMPGGLPGGMPGGMPGGGNAPGAMTLNGDWTGTAYDSLDNGQPLQYQAQVKVTQDPTGRISATYSSTIPYPDPQNGRTVQLLVQETFTGTLQNGTAMLTCPNVRVLEANSRQMLTSFPATLMLTLNAQGLTGSIGSDEMGFTEISFQRGGAPAPAWNTGSYGQQGQQGQQAEWNQGGWNQGAQNQGNW